MTSRAQIRQRIRQQRRCFSQAQRLVATEAICAHVAGSTLFRNSATLAGFVANENEPDLSAVMHQSWATGKAWHLPIIGLPFLNHLWFGRYDQGDRLKANRFGIAEPEVALARATPPWGLDLVLMPLVAFDLQGNRLGMGKGYYDRTLSYLRHRHHWRKPRLIGVAYEFQRVDALPLQRWDVPLDGVVTENSLYIFRYNSY